jgi:hypothetical protein
MLMFPLPILTFTAAFKHGPRQAYAIRILRQAIAEALLSDKEAAGVQDLTPTQWARQCGNHDGAHVSYQRIFEFPRAVLKALGKALYEENSDGGLCVESQQLQRLIELNARVASAMEQREQLRMELPEPKEARRTA